jgi:hypothetical protein
MTTVQQRIREGIWKYLALRAIIFYYLKVDYRAGSVA